VSRFCGNHCHALARDPFLGNCLSAELRSLFFDGLELAVLSENPLGIEIIGLAFPAWSGGEDILQFPPLGFVIEPMAPKVAFVAATDGPSEQHHRIVEVGIDGNPRTPWDIL